MFIRLNKFIICFVIMAMFLVFVTPIYSSSVSLEGQIVQGRFLVPMRGIFEALGATVHWDGDTRTVTGTKGDISVKLTIDSKITTVNNKKVELDVPATVIEGRTFVPARFISESLGANVEWDGEIRVATIIKDYIEIKVYEIEKEEKEPVETKPKEVSTDIALYDKNITGTVKGTLTWQYNPYVGTRGDVGAKIALIPVNLDENLDNNLFSLALSQNPQGKNGIFSTRADGYGHYELSNVPAGKYYLLFLSNNAFNDTTLSGLAQVLRFRFSEEEWRAIELNLKVRKHRVTRIEIIQNRTITESHDFGYSYI